MANNFNLSWESLKDVGNSGESTAYMKILPGENRIRVVGTAAHIDVHWEKGVDGSNHKIICSGNGCPVCAVGERPATRYQLLVLDRAESEPTVKVLDCGKSIISQIYTYASDADYGDPTQYDLKIKREGAGRETRYTVLASPKHTPLTAAEEAAVAAAPTLESINKIATPEDIMGMNLECLQGADDTSTADSDDADDWGNL